MIPYGLTIGVLAINTIISLLVTKGIEIIRPTSNSEKIARMTLFMSISYFINMGFIPVFIAGNYVNLTNSIFYDGNASNSSSISYYEMIQNLSSGNPDDINDVWYTIIGYQILSNLWLNCLTPNVSAMLTAGFNALKNVIFTSCHCICVGTQEDLKEIYIGPEFTIHTR